MIELHKEVDPCNIPLSDSEKGRILEKTSRAVLWAGRPDLFRNILPESTLTMLRLGTIDGTKYWSARVSAQSVLLAR